MAKTYKFKCPECGAVVTYAYSPIDLPLRLTAARLAAEDELPVESVYLTCKNNHDRQYYLADAEES